jgi:hypothetical protein
MPTRDTFARAFLREIEAPVKQHNLIALVAWMQAEGLGGSYNPLNTTLHMPGSTRFNFADVQNYVDFDQGVRATARTLVEGAHKADDPFGYRAILRRLRANAPARYTLKAVEVSAWGTGGLALACRKQTVNHYDHFAAMPIAT